MTMSFGVPLALRLGLVAAAASACVTMSGCASIGAGAGAVAGIAMGAFTTNPAIGFGVGIAVQAATDEVVAHTMKSLHEDQQVMIAVTAGTMTVGETRPWKVKHTLPVENGHGEVRVLREFSSALANCKKFAFSVVDGDDPNAHADWFLATALPAAERVEMGFGGACGRTMGESAVTPSLLEHGKRGSVAEAALFCFSRWRSLPERHAREGRCASRGALRRSCRSCVGQNAEG
ncbi:unnamed protein product [Candidatus Paraburkholderia kirkii UZHbot1]|uniref:WGS project CAFE00000000 data, contig bkir_c1 n=1 Tax=Candidatus Paraburkholderia kirkii UZHbot1 TaxID=1055526 RepID=U3UAE3_9BURK|nr:unnamed protein product [Candidatus Paraburkholderia kirkii UZHbot1]